MATRFITREQAREADRRAIEQLGVPSIVLMENAGRSCADLLMTLSDGPFVICAGKGNNGGDGFVIARHLRLHARPVTVLHFGSPNDLRGDALTNYTIIERLNIPTRLFADAPDPMQLRLELQEADWIVDALLGTGMQGEVREPFATAIGAINAAEAHVFAIDVPSGLDCNTGEPLGPCVRAVHTATFVAAKQGFRNPEASRFTGTVHVLDIGVPSELLV